MKPHTYDEDCFCETCVEIWRVNNHKQVEGGLAAIEAIKKELDELRAIKKAAEVYYEKFHNMPQDSKMSQYLSPGTRLWMSDILKDILEGKYPKGG